MNKLASLQSSELLIGQQDCHKIKQDLMLI